VPRDFWLTEEEKNLIIDYYREHPLDGYRRLTYMMIDGGVAAVAPSSVYRVLSNAGLLKRWNGQQSSKGTGFKQPGAAHQHWHIDISYINIAGTFYYLCSILDGYSRKVLHWEIRESMKEPDVELVIQRCRELYPDTHARLISDNGPQFIANDLKQFIRLAGMTHVRTSPFYPQSNGKLERFHKTLKTECIRPKTPLSLDDARRIITEFIDTYNNKRLHSAIGYVTPADMLAGRQKEIHTARDQKLEEARSKRKQTRLYINIAA
jgi:transposase InsO family protein